MLQKNFIFIKKQNFKLKFEIYEDTQVPGPKNETRQMYHLIYIYDT